MIASVLSSVLMMDSSCTLIGFAAYHDGISQRIAATPRQSVGENGRRLGPLCRWFLVLPVNLPGRVFFCGR